MADPNRKTMFGLDLDANPMLLDDPNLHPQAPEASAAPAVGLPGAPVVSGQAGLAPGLLPPGGATADSTGYQQAPAQPPGPAQSASYDEAVAGALRQLHDDPTKLSGEQMALLNQRNPNSVPGAGGKVRVGESSTSTNQTSESGFKDPTAVAAEHVKQEGYAADIERRNQELAKASIEHGNNAAQTALETANQLAGINTEQQKIQAERAAEMQRFTKQQEKDQADYLKAAKDVDPQRLLKGGNGLILGLAAGLGAFGASLAKSQNFAQQAIESALDRDLAQQKDALHARRDQMSFAQGVYQAKLAQFQSKEGALLAAKATVLNVAAEKQDALAMKYKGTEQATSLENSATATRSRASELYSAALQQEHVTRTKGGSTTTQYAETGGGGATGKNANQTAAEYAAQLADQKRKITAGFGEGLSEQEKSRVEKVNERMSGAVNGLQAFMDARVDVEKTNPLSRMFPNRVGGQDAQHFDSRMRVGVAGQRVAETGVAFSAREAEEQAQRYAQDGLYGGDTVKNRIDNAMESTVKSAHTTLMGLSGPARDALLRQYVEGGTDPRIIEAIRTGKLPESGGDSAAALGGKVR